MAEDSPKTSVLLPIGGGVAGATTSATIGGVGLVGSFGGIGLGMGAMTGVGALAGAAAYGAFQAIETGDTTAYTALGLGALGGASFYSIFGGVGLGIGGTAFGIGLGTMALSGGLVGLGIYGFSQIFINNFSVDNYYANLFFLEQITQEYQEEQFWTGLEIEDEFNQLKEQLKDKIDYQAFREQTQAKALSYKLKQKRSLLMEQLKTTYYSSKKFNLLQQIDELESEIKLIKNQYNLSQFS